VEGEAERAVATLREALAAARATGAALFEPFALTELAEAEAAAGRAEDARRCTAAAQAAAQRGGEVFWQSHARRAQERLADLPS
jgi:hypothetical protein